MENKILFEDENVIVAFKPCGVPAQADKTGDLDMVTSLSQHTEAEVYVINRLDRPVSGIMVFAKNTMAAASLSKDIQQDKFLKEYTAVLCGKPKEEDGRLTDWIVKDQKSNTSKIVKETAPGAKKAVLEYTTIKTVSSEEFGTLTLVKVALITGRHHQIRVQLANYGVPIWGDSKYNEAFKKRRGFDGIALCSSSLTFKHPKSGKQKHFEVTPGGSAFKEFASTPTQG